MDEAQIDQPVALAAPIHGPSLLTIVGFAFLALNTAITVYCSDKGLGAIAFVAFFYLDFILLVYCLALHDAAAPGSPRREHLKVAVWLLTTMLTFVFWPLLDLWFKVVGNLTQNSSMTFQNHTSCAQLHLPYQPSVLRSCAKNTK
ncbi:unnamed protein product [Urochloa humidicola]